MDLFGILLTLAFGLFVYTFGEWFPIVLVVLVVLWLIKMSRR